MTVPIVEGQFYPTLEELRDVGLRAMAAGAERRGKTVNILPGSEYFLRFDAIATAILPAFSNGKLGLKAVSPLDALEDDLVELAGVFGILRRAASPAAGLITVAVVSGSVTIPSGYVCSASDGTKYQTVTAATVADGETVEVIATKGGSSTNKAVGGIVKWDSASIGQLRQNATIAVGGLTGGADEDSVETVRQRLLDRLSSPGGGGNWSAIKLLAENASASVSKAFVYPAPQGPATYGVAVLKADGDRTLSSAIVNAVGAAIVGDMPGHASLNITTVNPLLVDVIIGLDLPKPVFAGGVGGGWRDATPWPNATSGPVKVTSFNSGTGEITTDATALDGLAVGSHIGLWWPADEEMHEYIVTSASIPVSNVVLTVNGGFAEDYSGAYLSAGAENLTAYASAALTAIQALGPGEKTDAFYLLPRALRKPAPATSSPSDLGSRVLDAIGQEQPEILTLEYVARYAAGGTVPLITPSIPATSSDEPNVLVLNYLAFQET